jgi:aminomethyltransferase
MTSSTRPERNSGIAPRTTALHGIHKQLGAQFTEFAGWAMPVRYQSDVEEHHAVRRAAGLFDLSHMAEIEVTGSGAAAAMDYAVVGKASAMRPGQARYSMICNESGGILDDLVVYRLAPERYLVVANAANTWTVYNALAERVDGYDARVANVTDDWVLVAVQGPGAEEILSATSALDLAPVRYYTVVSCQVLGADVLLARTGYTGEDGFEIYCRPETAELIWHGLIRAGQAHGLAPAGLACRDTLRLEAGMPLYGHELSALVTPFEVGLGRLVSFTKEHGFVGDEALATRRNEGPRSTLVGLVPEGRRSPRHGYAVLKPGVGAEPARHVGHVTSGAPSPTLGHPIAIAAVSPELAEPGVSLAVDVRGTPERAQVVPLPFYRRPNT